MDRLGNDGRGASRGCRSTWAAGSTFWVRLSQATPRERSDAALRIAGALPSHLTSHERFGFGLRVAATFDPSTGNPLPPNGAAHG
jgi:hypothetical protein